MNIQAKIIESFSSLLSPSHMLIEMDKFGNSFFDFELHDMLLLKF